MSRRRPHATGKLKTGKVMKQYDAVIIGFGKAGKTLAAELAAHD